ncbi:MAG: hypothetical protein EBZ50_07440 [Alphaproteobacteria bacterium]|nr:hypothetical protein [Alphaproteobacteria bacterium]
MGVGRRERRPNKETFMRRILAPALAAVALIAAPAAFAAQPTATPAPAAASDSGKATPPVKVADASTPKKHHKAVKHTTTSATAKPAKAPEESKKP